jgi:hypothetical protein
MSRWHALAYVRGVSDADLRDRLTDAVEALYDAEAGADDVCSYPCLPSGGGIADEIRSARAEAEDQEQRADRAEIALEEKLQGDEDDPAFKARLDILTEDLRGRLAKVTSERDELLTRIAHIEIQSEAYSDALAMARRFVSVGTKAGTPVKHVRVARRSRVAS